MTTDTPEPCYERYRLAYPSGTVVMAFYAGGAPLDEGPRNAPPGGRQGGRGFAGVSPLRYQQHVTTTIQFYGRLGRTPSLRTTAAGKAMVTGAMVVDLGRDGGMPEWFSLVAFGAIGEVLARHAKGDMVAVSGRLTKSAWRAGTARSDRASRCSLIPSRALARLRRHRIELA